MKKERCQILMQIENVNNRLKNVRNLFADGKMDERDYRDLEDECHLKWTSWQENYPVLKM